MSPIAAIRAAIRFCRMPLLGLTLSFPPCGANLSAAEPIRMKVLGGLGQVSQFERFEAPFWTVRVPELTGGRVVVDIAPSDRSGIRGQDMLRLMRLGVVPFGTVTLALAAAEEPELNGVDLPALNPDQAALRRTTALWRPRLAALLRERYDLELLALYSYPAQVLFCRGAFAGLGDLAGRKVRTSSVGQAELMAALGAVPVILPFAETVSAVRNGVVSCAITGTLSGNAIGLHEVTTHLSPVSISWGVSLFAANTAAWAALPADDRAAIAAGIGTLEATIWDAADRETAQGIACNTGAPGCDDGRPGRLVLVGEPTQEASRRRALLEDIVLPAWVQRCGGECATQWNRFMAPTLGLVAKAD